MNKAKLLTKDRLRMAFDHFDKVSPISLLVFCRTRAATSTFKR